MAAYLPKQVSKQKQYIISLLLIVIVGAVCYNFSEYLGYRVIAFILLFTVSLIAVSFDILPVLVAATASAFIWDFFFIPPRFNLHVNNTEDIILLVMYFVISMINAVLTYRIRQVEKASAKKEEKANTLKLYDTMLNSLSHELRTPIATILAATDNIQASNNKLTEKDKEELITEISKASLRLNQQVDNLLNMSRLESGFIKPKNGWCDIYELVYDTVKKLEENKITQKISISINPDLPFVKTDKVMLGQVIYNLLNNASLYTEPSSRISITVAIHADLLQVIIEDNGAGFPEEEIENVFDKFYRLKYSKPGGTGLGLSIVKGFTEALKGTVSLQNISSGGARFTIEIPCETSYLNMQP
jgi:two-component system sensor histidine kinase KdpD